MPLTKNTWPQHNRTKCDINWSSQDSCLAQTKQIPGELSELPALNKQAHTHPGGTCSTQPSQRHLCTARDNEEDKTHHINYPTNMFFWGHHAKHSSEALLRTSAVPARVPRQSWVLNLRLLRTACHQPLLWGRERRRECAWARGKKMRIGERRGWW